MSHSLFPCDWQKRDGHISDDQAREDITSMVNDPELVRYMCAFFHEKTNMDATCYAIGKVYDVNGGSFGCVSVISEDIANMIGEEGQEMQEKINHALVSAFLEFRSLCEGGGVIAAAWDQYLDLVLARAFPPFFENGMRARLMDHEKLAAASLPMAIFAVYQQYDAL